MKKSLSITVAVAVVILVAAAAVLGVLSAYAGQQSGLEKSKLQHCKPLTREEAQDVTNPQYGERLAQLARCKSQAAR